MVVRIIHMIGSLDIGGSQTMIMNIYRKIDRNRIQFDFIVDHSDQLYFKEEIEKLGGRVFVMPRFNGKNIFQVQKAWNCFFDAHGCFVHCSGLVRALNLYRFRYLGLVVSVSSAELLLVF